MADYSEFIQKNFFNIEGFRIFFPGNNITFTNPPFDKARLKVLIVRLSPLKNIRESITHHFLFQEVRRTIPSAYIDYAFFPDPENIQLFTENKIPFFPGIQSRRALPDFDLVLVSNSFTLELFNIPYLFINTGIPALKSERNLSNPLVVMGGSSVLMAQCAISPRGDSYIDAFFFGEGEGSAGRIAELVADNHKKSRTELLNILEDNIRGFFNIRLPIPDSLSIASPVPPCDSYILTDYPILNTDIENTAKVQISQGCPCFCSFCFEGYTRKPFREYDISGIIKKALEIKLKHAPFVFDLLSFNFNLHTGISKLITELNEKAKFVSFKSQRADIISMIPEIIDIEILSGKRSFTIGVEGISDRMRRFFQKSLTEKDLLAALTLIYAKKPRQLKLFFIITGFENEADLHDFKSFIKKLKLAKNNCRTIMSFGFISNLPFTPLQFSPTIKNPESIKDIKGNLKRDCETNGFEFRIAQDIEDFLISQHLALAGFECFDVISHFAYSGGYFDGKYINGNKHELLHSLRLASGEDIYYEKDETYIFPFEKIKGTPDKRFLYRMYKDARNFKDGGYCLDGKGSCIGCGGCDEPRLLRIPTVSSEDLSRLRTAEMNKKRPAVVQASVIVKETGRFLTPEAKCAFIGREVLMRLPPLAPFYLACRQVQNMPASKGYGYLFGRFLYDFEFTGASEIFLEYLKNNIIDNPVLIITSASSENGKRFRISSLWKNTSQYSFQNRLQDYLLSRGLGYDIRKHEGLIHFEIARKDRKKKILKSALFQQKGSDVMVEIDTDSNFLIIDMLKVLFEDSWMYAEVEAV